jgi:putative lipoprotein (rSAM/lipoprotein system)
MKSLFTRFLDVFFPLLMALLGFSSCSSIIDCPCEYGCPNADFKTVVSVSDESGNPIKGIQIISTCKYTNDSKLNKSDTLYTDSYGMAGKTVNLITLPDRVGLTFNDVDGDENGGNFTSVSISDSDIVRTKKSSGWYEGEFTVTINEVLKKDSK